jgi:hypothetical protein
MKGYRHAVLRSDRHHRLARRCPAAAAFHSCARFRTAAQKAASDKPFRLGLIPLVRPFLA